MKRRIKISSALLCAAFLLSACTNLSADSSESTLTPSALEPSSSDSAGSFSESTSISSEPGSSTSSSTSGSQPSSGSSEQGGSVPVTNMNADWRLILVNPTHRLPDDFSVETAPVQGGYEMDVRVADTMKQMIADAQADGINLQVISGTRSMAYQVKLFNRDVEKYKARGYSDTDAYAQAAMNVAVPGTSEHQLGLAVDVLSTDWGGGTSEGFAETTAYQWLIAHCADYGFIERFPKGKTDITKITWEPWHYRYVGVEHAKKIMAEGICLEEYLGER